MSTTLQDIVNKINDSGLPGSPIRAADVVDHRQIALPFYTSTVFWELHRTPAEHRLCYLANGRDLLHLDGAASNIYAANRSMKLVLRDDDVVAYAWFFFAAVGDGKLRIVGRARADALHGIAPAVFPPRIIGRGPQGWRLHLCGEWETLLLEMEIQVARSGEITPLRRAPLGEIGDA